MNRPPILPAALYFARLGFSFYPTRPRSKEPFSEILPTGTMKNGKRGPVWSPFQSERPDARQIRTWFEIAPDSNIALITGVVSRLVIIEFDTLEAALAFCALCAVEHLTDFCTPLVQSRRGWHLYFLHPGFEVRGQIGIDDCEVKGDGLSCTAPPSIHATGHFYKFLVTPNQAPLSPLPTPVVERLQSNLSRQPAIYPAVTRQLLPDSGSAYGRKALQNACDTLCATRESRHNAINGASYSIGRVVGAGAMDYSTAFAALENAARCTGFPAAECGRLVRDGLAAGIQSPRHIENRRAENREYRAPVRANKARPTLAEMRGKGAFA